MSDRAAHSSDASSSDIVAQADQLAEKLTEAKTALNEVIFGQPDVINQTLVTLISGGHGLLVGVPGLAKTKLVAALSTVFGLPGKRIQCTPDLMPADVLGSEILDETDKGKRAFRFVEGPVFTSLLVADEINRASPRTQSALLQAMQERVVSVAGEDRALPEPFHVFATQNPIEQEGTYPLPEAQLDRFLLQVFVDYPDIETEKRIVTETTGVEEAEVRQVLDAKTLLEAQALVRQMPVGEQVVDAILNVVRDARPKSGSDSASLVHWGPGPRAGQAFMLAVRAAALIDGRYAPSVEDVIAMAGPVLRHRMALTFSARADGMTNDDVITRLIEPFA